MSHYSFSLLCFFIYKIREQEGGGGYAGEGFGTSGRGMWWGKE
jgi:hypothetical protein